MTRFPPALAAALAFLLLISFGIDARNVSQGGAIDLRNRVTGARLLEDHIDPYSYKWSRSQPEVYCDPYNNPRLPVSKTTSTPALLALSLPLAILPYRTAEYLWFVLQWMLLLGSGWCWWRLCLRENQRVLLGLLLTAFTYTAAWRLHVERGQSYVLLLFFFALWSVLTLKAPTRYGQILAGLALGLVATLRPPFLLLIPLIAWRWRGQLPGVIAGLMVGCVLPLFFLPPSWGDYFSAMQVHSDLYRMGIDTPPGPQTFPPLIEGMSTDLLASFAAIPYADFSVHALLRDFGLEPFPASALLLAGVILMAAWLCLIRRTVDTSLVLNAAVSVFLFDLLLPAYRNNYNDVLALGFLGTAAATAPAKFSPAFLVGLAALAVGGAIYFFSPEQAWLINLPSALLTLSGFLLATQSVRRSTAPRASGKT